MITKERIARILLRIAFVMLIACAQLLTGGCGSKKKLTQRSQFTTEIAKVERVNELTEADIKITKETASGTKKTTEKESENFQAEIDDPTKPASITKKEKDGETIWELDNIKNFNSGKEKSKEQSKDIVIIDLQKISKTKTGKTTKRKTEAKASGSERTANVDIERGFPWWILIVLGLYLAVSFFRKTLNPLRW